MVFCCACFGFGRRAERNRGNVRKDEIVLASSQAGVAASAGFIPQGSVLDGNSQGSGSPVRNLDPVLAREGGDFHDIDSDSLYASTLSRFHSADSRMLDRWRSVSSESDCTPRKADGVARQATSFSWSANQETFVDPEVLEQYLTADQDLYATGESHQSDTQKTGGLDGETSCSCTPNSKCLAEPGSTVLVVPNLKGEGVGESSFQQLADTLTSGSTDSTLCSEHTFSAQLSLNSSSPAVAACLPFSKSLPKIARPFQSTTSVDQVGSPVPPSVVSAECADGQSDAEVTCYTVPAGLARMSRRLSNVVAQVQMRMQVHHDEPDQAGSLRTSADTQNHVPHPGPHLPIVSELTRKLSVKLKQVLHSPAPSMEDIELLEPTVSSEREKFLILYDRSYLRFVNTVYGTNARHLKEVPLLPVAPWNRKPGYLGFLTHEQQHALAAIRKEFPGTAEYLTDHDILRFLRARDFDLKETRVMLDKYIKEFRCKLLVSPVPSCRPTMGEPYDLEQFEMLPPRDPDLTRRFRLIFEHFVHVAVLGTSKEGVPVVYMQPAALLKHHMSHHVPLQDRVALQCASIEATRLLCHQASAAAKFQVEEVVQVLDLEGLSPIGLLQHVRSSDSQVEFQHNMDFAPESLHKVIVINAPFGAQTVWKAVSVLLPPRTTTKFAILGKSYKAELCSMLGKENVPVCYGGSLSFSWPQLKPVSELKY